MFYKIRVFKNFTKFKIKHLCQSLFLIDRKPPDDCFYSTEKYFTNKVAKSPLEKEEKIEETTGKKNNNARRKINLTSNHIKLYPLTVLKNFFAPFFSASHDALTARIFRSNAIAMRIYLQQKIIFHLW